MGCRNEGRLAPPSAAAKAQAPKGPLAKANLAKLNSNRANVGPALIDGVKTTCLLDQWVPGKFGHARVREED